MAKNNYKENNNLSKTTEKQNDTVNATPVKPKPQIDLSKLNLTGGTVKGAIQNDDSNIVDVIKDIINSNVDVINRLNKLDNSYSKLAISLLDYEKRMNRENSQTLEQADIGSSNYNLYNRLMKVLKISSYPDFVQHFDIVNFIFNKFKDSAYSEFAINRADLYFTGDQKQLKTFQHVITLICILCDPIKRNANKRVISTKAALDMKVISLTEVEVNNIKHYYDL